MVETTPLPATDGPARWRPLATTAILALNLLVFLAWQASWYSADLGEALGRHFAVSPNRLAAGWWWTLLTAEFSHIELWHLVFNLVVLWGFGAALERVLGRRRYVAFYLTAAVVASACHCFVTAVLVKRGDVAAVGASGALAGVLMVFALLFPRQRILLFMVIPIPALAGALAFVALDLWGLVAQSGGGGLPIGHGAHLGGSLTGLLFYLAVLRPRLAGRAATVAPERGRPALNEDEAREVERLHAKLTREGFAALTPKEQDFLRRLRERALAE